MAQRHFRPGETEEREREREREREGMEAALSYSLTNKSVAITTLRVCRVNETII